MGHRAAAPFSQPLYLCLREKFLNGGNARHQPLHRFVFSTIVLLSYLGGHDNFAHRVKCVHFFQTHLFLGEVWSSCQPLRVAHNLR